MINFEKGTLICDRYRVLERLGMGGQGAVFKVKDTAEIYRKVADTQNNDQPLAVKVVVWDRHEDGEDLVKRLNTEYKVLQKLSHPNIVKVFDHGVLDEHSCFIAMEYIDGTVLSERLSPVWGPLPFEEVLQILREVALGLECAHDAKVIHRDLKPANIMLTNYGEVKILDFGLARDMELGMTMTKTGETIGTPYYMSPEQFTRLTALDERVDIYALGMIAYELVAGRPPFKEEAYHEVAYAHLRNSIPPLESKNYKLPRWFHSFVCVCGEKRPSNRYQSMREVVDFLERRMAKMKLIKSASNPEPRWLNSLGEMTWGR